MLTTRIWRSCAKPMPAVAVLLLALASGTAQAQLPPLGDLRARAGDAQAELRWFHSGHRTVEGFEMRFATDATAFSSAVPPQWIAIAGGDDREHVVPDLANGTRYYFEVRAYGQDAFGHVVGAADTTTVQLAATPNEAVEIPDERLRDRLLPIGKAWQDPITQLDLARRDNVYAQGQEIRDLTGLEHVVNARPHRSEGTLS